jgi:hypothetical protein
MGNISSTIFNNPLPAVLVKEVLLRGDQTNRAITKIDIKLTLQNMKLEDGEPFSLFVALVTDRDALAALQKNPSALQYEISTPNSPSVKTGRMLKKYIGVEDFFVDKKIRHLLNTRDGAGVTTKEISVGMDIFATQNQDLWIYCIPYQSSKGADDKVKQVIGKHRFQFGAHVVEPIFAGGAPPTTTYLYTLAQGGRHFGQKGDVWPGAVTFHKNSYYVKPVFRALGPKLKRSQVSNQKIKDLRVLEIIDGLDLDNFVFNTNNINRSNVKKYEKVKGLLGKKYFSPFQYCRDSKGAFKLFLGMDYNTYIQDNARLANLFANKGSLKSCFTINEVSVYRERKNEISEGSKLTAQPIAPSSDFFVEPPKFVGDLSSAVATIDMGLGDFLNFVITDKAMKKEEISNFEYTITFEFVDSTAQAVKNIVDRLEMIFTEFQSFMSKFEGLGKKNYDIEEYLRVNADTIKSDDSWVRLIDEFLASILFIFGPETFGNETPLVWKKNLTTMINPMCATDETFREFTETIKGYIGDLRNIVSLPVVGRSDKKFSTRSKVAQTQEMVRKIKYTYKSQKVKKTTDADVGFDYLGIAKFLKESGTGLSGIELDDFEKRMNLEINKYKVANPNVTSINRYGFLSPYRIYTPYETQDTFGDHLELADGLIILENNKNPSISQFIADGSPQEVDLKISTMMSILGTSGIYMEPLFTGLTEHVAAKLSLRDEEQSDSDDYFDVDAFTLEGQSAEDHVSGSSGVRFRDLQGQKSKMLMLESDLAEKMVDGIAQNFTDFKLLPRPGSAGSLAHARIHQNLEEFRDTNSFERDIFYNSLKKIETLTGYFNDNIRRPKWEVLTAGQLAQLKETDRSILCRLSPCPPVTSAPTRYNLGAYNHLFVLGDGFAGQKQMRANYLKRYKGYLTRMTALNQSVAANIARPEANYGPEYYVASAPSSAANKGVGKKVEKDKKAASKKGKTSKLTQRRAQSMAALENTDAAKNTGKKGRRGGY